MLNQTRRTAARLALSALVLAAAAIAIPSSAQATAASETPEVCWLNTDDDAYQCFDSYADFAAASGIDHNASRGLADIEPYAVYTLAIFYEDASYGGSSTVVTTSNSSLCSGYHYYGTAMPAGWNDRVSSFSANGTCKVKLWKDTGYAGTAYGPFSAASSIGSMNDESSSYQIYAS